MGPLLLLALPLSLGVGCAHPTRSYVFTVPAGDTHLLDRLAQRLEEDGHQVGRIDRSRQEILSGWENTHYRFRETPDMEHETTIFLRYRVRLLAEGQETRASLEAEAQRCAADSAYVTPLGVQGTCVPMKRLFPTQQKAVDQLGEHLAAAVTPAAGAR